jgi:hypothetical protein
MIGAQGVFIPYSFTTRPFTIPVLAPAILLSVDLAVNHSGLNQIE